MVAVFVTLVVSMAVIVRMAVVVRMGVAVVRVAVIVMDGLNARGDRHFGRRLRIELAADEQHQCRA